MHRRFVAFIMSLVMLLGISVTASASEITERGSSYTYVDLGTAEYEYSSEAIVESAKLLADIIIKTLGIPITAGGALELADRVLELSDAFPYEKVYYRTEVHTTQVFLDGEFVYYEIEEYTEIYADPDYEDLVDVVEHTGKSLSPLSIEDECV